MGTVQVSVAAATAVVGYDLLQNNPLQVVSYDRLASGLGLAGSAAALDTEINVFVDGVRYGNFFNTATGAVLMDSHMQTVEIPIPAGAKISAVVTDAPA